MNSRSDKGLNDKTNLSFTSSNSSFSKCVRNHHIFLSNSDSNLNDPTCLIDGRQTSSPACDTSSRNTLNTGSTYEFSWCTWSSCSASGDAGGALKCTGTGSKVYVERCSFSSCSAYKQGGAIHTSSIHTLDVKDSLFYACSSSTKENDEGSGAMWIYGIQQKLSISETSFISCTTKASGGACIIQKCSSNIKGQIINQCRCIHCNATDMSPDGGALYIPTSTELIGLEECLFSLCHSLYGGALDHSLSNYKEHTYPIRYCFFNKNTVSESGYGNDVVLRNHLLDNNNPVLQHSFSTSTSIRVGYYYNSNWYKNDFNWLPHVVR